MATNIGTCVLYMLSAKKFMPHRTVKGYVVNNRIDILPYNLLRDLCAMNYIFYDKGTNRLKIISPMLVELPFKKPRYLLTGARSQKLVEMVDNIAKISRHEHLPSTIVVDAKHVDKFLRRHLQGSTVADYVKIYRRPLAWDLLEFSRSVTEVKNSLNWLEGDDKHVKRVFDTEQLRFVDYTEREQGLMLAEIKGFSNQNRYCLFNKKTSQMATIDKDCGRIVACADAGRQVMKYDRRSMRLRCELYLPDKLEKGLVLCSGSRPHRNGMVTVFKKITPDVANCVANKLRQNLQFGEINV